MFADAKCKSLGANWNDDARRKRPAALRGLDEVASFPRQYEARQFFFTFFFPSCIYFFFFLSWIPEFRNVYIRWSTTSRVQFHTAAKRWQHSTVLRRIKMTDRRLEGGKCYEKRQFLHQFIVSFRLSRFFKYIGRYLLAFNKCLINFNLQGDALLSYYLF